MGNLHLKLAIGSISVIALLVLATFLNEPLWWMMQSQELCSDDSATYTSAIIDVVEQGPDALPHVREWLKSRNPRLVLASCRILENLNTSAWKRALPELKSVLKKLPSSTTDAAARVLITRRYPWFELFFGDRRAISAMYSYLFRQETDVAQKELMANSIAEIGDEIALSTLSNALTSSKVPEVRAMVAKRLAWVMWPSSVRYLVQALKNDNSSSVRVQAVKSLGDIGDPSSIRSMVKAMESDVDISVQRAAARALGVAGRETAAGPLLKILEDESIDVSLRMETAHALGWIGLLNTSDSLICVMADRPGYAFEMRCIEALGRIGSEKAVPVLLPFIEPGHKFRLRELACIALGRIGDKRAVQPLLDILGNDSETRVRLPVIEALGRINDSRAAPVLLQELEDADDLWIIGRAASSYRRVCQEDEILLLLEFMKNDPRPLVRGTVAQIIGSSDDPRAAKELMEMLKSDLDYPRGCAAQALWFQHSAEAGDALVAALLNDSNETVRAIAAIGLGIQMYPKAVKPLLRTLKDDSSRYARTAAAIAMMAFEDTEIVPCLRSALVKGNRGAAVALAFIVGGKDLDSMRHYLQDIPDALGDKSAALWTSVDGTPSAYISAALEARISAADARWGHLLGMLNSGRIGFLLVYPQLEKQMPPGFPHKNLRKIKKTEIGPALREIMKWLKKNRYRIGWNKRTNQYFLR